MITKSQANRFSELLGLVAKKVEDMIFIEGVGIFWVICATRRSEVATYLELRIVNEVVEGINNKFKLIKRLGYGFHNFDNFKLGGLLPWFFPFKAI